MTPTFWIVALINFVNALSFTILIPTIYLYGKEFQLDDFQTSLLFAVYSLAQFFATPIIGKLSDRFGRKPLLIISLAGTVAANLLAGTASTAAMLFFARFLDGITGGNVSVAQAIITDITGPEDRAKGFGILGASLGLGFVLGPVISLASLSIRQNPQSVGISFLVSSAVASIALVLTVLRLPETLPPERRRASGSILDLGLDKLVSGLVLPGVGILLIVNFLTGTTFTMFTYAFQPYYLKVLGQDVNSLTKLFFAFGIMGVLMQTQGLKVLVRRLAISKILFLGLFFRSICFALMPIVPDVRYFVAVSLVFAIFNSLVQPAISTLISMNTRPEEQGMAAGLNASYLSISNGIGPVIAGLMIDQRTTKAAEIAEKAGGLVNPANYSSYNHPLYAAGLCTFGVLILAIRLQRQYGPKTAASNSSGNL
jgi:MFS family permease